MTNLKKLLLAIVLVALYFYLMQIINDYFILHYDIPEISWGEQLVLALVIIYAINKKINKDKDLSGKDKDMLEKSR